MLDRHIHSNGMAANAGPSIQAAIDAVAQGGGGRVTLGAGVHRSTTIRLRSHVRLHLEAGCVLAALDDASGFPIVDQLPANPGHVRTLVYADGETGLTITGPGTIAAWGSEEVSWQQANAMRFRPALVYMRDCREVRLDRLTLRDSVFWTCHLLRCRSVQIEQVTIRNRWPNSDGALRDFPWVRGMVKRCAKERADARYTALSADSGVGSALESQRRGTGRGRRPSRHSPRA